MTGSPTATVLGNAPSNTTLIDRRCTLTFDGAALGRVPDVAAVLDGDREGPAARRCVGSGIDVRQTVSPGSVSVGPIGA